MTHRLPAVGLERPDMHSLAGMTVDVQGGGSL